MGPSTSFPTPHCGPGGKAFATERARNDALDLEPHRIGERDFRFDLPFPEGMARAAVNDGDRGAIAAVAQPARLSLLPQLTRID